MANRIFLTAQWRDLLMLNFRVDPGLLLPHLPAGTELDLFRDEAYVSVVGFTFLETKVCGIAVPRYRDFPEVNLRFYVRRLVAGGWRRGVVFVREISPKWFIGAVARTVYQESYVTRQMRSHRGRGNAFAKSERPIDYRWRTGKRWNRLAALPVGIAQLPAEGSLEHFIIEHYWGYSARSDGRSLEYEVQHPRWWICSVENVAWQCDVEANYGSAFENTLNRTPDSALWTSGSAVAVCRGTPIGTDSAWTPSHVPTPS